MNEKISKYSQVGGLEHYAKNLKSLSLLSLSILFSHPKVWIRDAMLLLILI